MISENVKTYCYEDPSLIENYELAIADTKMWHCHHRVETIMNCGAKELKAQGCYENRPAHDLIFLTKSEHSTLHNAGKTHSVSVETRAKISEARRGKPNGRRGKHHSVETRAKISASISGENNPMYGKTLSVETRAKMSAAHTGQRLGWHFWTNGVENQFCKECPGEGWRRGRI